MGNNKQINRAIGLLEAYKRLSPREIEVFEKVEKGKTTKEIAAELNLSRHTVKKHRENIRRKLKITGPNGLFKWIVFHK